VALPADAPGLVDQPLADVDAAIAVWAGNLTRDRADFIAAVNLSELYLARVRLTADQADTAKALQAAGAALTAVPGVPAATLLRGQAHFANHDFALAAADAQTVLTAQPDALQALSALGDARLELGDYETAAALFDRLSAATSGPAVLARRARLASLTGSLATARRLVADTPAAAAADPDARPEIVSWYHSLVGTLAFQAGDVAAATAAYRRALDVWPGSAPALAGLARSIAAAGDLEAAIPLYQRSVAIQPRPEVLAALGDLYQLTGNAEAAASTYATVRAVASLGPTDRQVSLFESNHHEDTAQAVELARADLAKRHDVYAHDTLAWALLADGDAAGAQAEMQLALAQHTEDPMLDYHAGMIAASLGRSDSARSLLSAALARNPGFDPLQVVRLKSALASLH
jgi:tetratricopeptide (TPR) repeat protein